MCARYKHLTFSKKRKGRPGSMAEEEEVKLLGAGTSPYSCRVELALRLKEVGFHPIEEDLSNKSELLLKSNPVHKKIPVLIHNGKPIAESLVIVEYIDETWKNEGHSILPQDPLQRAHARFWAKFVDDKCLPALFEAFRSEDGEKMAEGEEYLRILDKEVEGKRFFGGDSIGLPDIAANILAFWLPLFGELRGVEVLTEAKFPALCKWKSEFLGNHVVRSSLPPKDKVLHRLKARFGSSAAPSK